jgi:hypothetical protein
MVVYSANQAKHINTYKSVLMLQQVVHSYQYTSHGLLLDGESPLLSRNAKLLYHYECLQFIESYYISLNG